MKRILIFLIIIPMILTSCSKEQKVKEDFISFPFESEMRVEYDGVEYVLDITMTSESDVCLTFKSPARLKDFKLKLADGKTTLIYQGIELMIDGEYAKNNGILLISRVFLCDKSSFESASIVKISGAKYCRQRYIENGNTVDMFFEDGKDRPSFIEAQINGRKFSINL